MTEEFAVSEPPEVTDGTTEVLRRGFRGSIAVTVCRVLTGIAALAFSIYTATYLTEQQFAGLKAIRSLVILATVLTSLGLNACLLRFVPELLAKGANAALRRLVARAALLKIAAVLIVSCFLLGAYGVIDRFFHLPPAMKPLLPLIAAYLTAVLLSDFLVQGLLASFLDQTFYSIVTVFMVGCYTTVAAWSLLQGYGLEGVLWSLVGFTVVALVVLSIRAGVRLAPVVRGKPGTAIDIRSRVRRFATISALITGGSALRNAAMDVLVISRYFGDWEVALYGFASGIILMAYQYLPMSNIGSILIPLVAREYSRTGDREKLVFFFRLATKLAAHTSVPLLVGLYVFLPGVISYIFNRPEWLPSINVARLFIAYMVLKLFSAPFRALYSALERPEFSLYSISFSLLNLGLLFVLVPSYGIIGAAAATCGVAPLLYAYHWVVFRRVLKLPLRMPWTSLVRVSVNLVPPVILGLWFRSRIDSDALVVAGFLLFGIVYLACALANRIFDQREKAMLARAMGRWSRFF